MRHQEPMPGFSCGKARDARVYAKANAGAAVFWFAVIGL